MGLWHAKAPRGFSCVAHQPGWDTFPPHEVPHPTRSIVQKSSHNKYHDVKANFFPLRLALSSARLETRNDFNHDSDQQWQHRSGHSGCELRTHKGSVLADFFCNNPLVVNRIQYTIHTTEIGAIKDKSNCSSVLQRTCTPPSSCNSS